MNRIRDLFKSNLFILLFSIALNLIFEIFAIAFHTEIDLVIIILIPLSLLWGPITGIGFCIVQFAIILFYGSPDPMYSTMSVIMTMFLNLAVWKFWYTMMKKYGYEIPNLSRLYNIIKVFAILLINAIFVIGIYKGYSTEAVNVNVYLMMPLSIISTIFSIYLVTQFKIPVYTPKKQFREIVPKKIFSIALILGLVLCLIKIFIPVMDDSLLITILIISILLIYLLKPYDEEVFKIKETYDLNLFTKGIISIFIVLLAFAFILGVGTYYLNILAHQTALKAVSGLLETLIGLFVSFLVPTLIYLYMLEKNVTIPLNKLSEALSRKIGSHEDYLKIEEDLKSIKTNNELSTLVDSLLELENKYLEYEDNLMKVSSEKKRLETELKLAHDIQESMIPTDSEEFCDKFDNRFELDSSMEAAEEIGGSFYDYFQIDEENIGFVIGDASGKGIPASLIMVKAITLIQDYARQYNDLSKALYDVNNILCEDHIERNGVSCWLGKLNIKTGKLLYVNAGHNQPLVRLNVQGFEFMTTKPDPKLAIMENTSFETHTMQLNKDDAIFLYTKGITETENENQESYGEERLFETLNRHESNDLNSVIEFVKSDLDKFRNNEQKDDRTMFIIRMKSDVEDAGDADVVEVADATDVVDGDEKSDNAKSISINPEISELIALNEFIHNMVEDFQVDLIVEEVFANIVDYSNCEHITVNALMEDDLLTLEFIDDGIEFNPLSNEDPEKPNNIEDAAIGGLGILLTKEMSDEIEYNYVNGKNHLKIFKKIDSLL